MPNTFPWQVNYPDTIIISDDSEDNQIELLPTNKKRKVFRDDAPQLAKRRHLNGSNATKVSKTLPQAVDNMDRSRGRNGSKFGLSSFNSLDGRRTSSSSTNLPRVARSSATRLAQISPTINKQNEAAVGNIKPSTTNDLPAHHVDSVPQHTSSLPCDLQKGVSHISTQTRKLNSFQPPPRLQTDDFCCPTTAGSTPRGLESYRSIPRTPSKADLERASSKLYNRSQIQVRPTLDTIKRAPQARTINREPPLSNSREATCLNTKASDARDCQLNRVSQSEVDLSCETSQQEPWSNSDKSCLGTTQLLGTSAPHSGNENQTNKLTEFQKWIDTALNGRPGGVIGNDQAILNYDEEINHEIETVNRDDAISLLRTNQSKHSASKKYIEKCARIDSNIGSQNHSLANTLQPVETTSNYRNTQVYRNRPLEPYEVTDNDWRLVQWRNEGFQWKDIYPMWRSLTHRLSHPRTIRQRFCRMKATYPEAIKKANEGVPNKPSGLSSSELAVRNKMIAHRLKEGENIDDFNISAESLASKPNNVQKHAKQNPSIAQPHKQTEQTIPEQPGIHEPRSTQGSSETPMSPTRTQPQTSGKKISQDLANYILATLSGSYESETETEIESGKEGDWREVSPIQDEDRTHFIFFVKRRVLENDDDDHNDGEWQVCSDSFTSVSEANEAAISEIKLNRGPINVLPFTSWTSSISEDTGMICFSGTGVNGTIEVKVDRAIRNYHEGILPNHKTAWLHRKVYDAIKKTSTFEEVTGFGEETVEWDEDAIEEALEEGDAQQYSGLNTFEPFDSAYASQAGTEDASPNIERLFSEDLPGQEQNSTSSMPAKVVIRTITRVCRITKLKTITRTENVVEAPIGGICAVQDRANRIAGDEYLRLLKKMDPDPKAQRLSMRNFEADQRARRELDTKMDQLEEDHECFAETIEFDNQRHQQSKEISESHNTQFRQRVEVKAVPRMLLNPRNF